MYGFGDDRNPSNDTVNVMEEILIEYITDVVSFSSPHLIYAVLILVPSARLLGGHHEKLGCPLKIFEEHCRGLQMQRNLRD